MDQKAKAEGAEVQTPWELAQVFKHERPSGDFPYESRYIEIEGDKIHYIDEGEGDPILFVHGVPDSCHSWRNIVPHVVPFGRAIALDLPGHGQSDKPRLTGYDDVYRRFEGFIDALNLRNITLVIIDWGAILGLHYARTHEDKVKGVVMMEAPIAPNYPLNDPEGFRQMGGGAALEFYRTMKTPIGEELIVNRNAFINTMLPGFVVRRMRQSELDVLRTAYQNTDDRWNLLMYPRMVPIEGEPADTHDVYTKNNEWLLSKEKTPTLLIWFRPGMVILPDQVQWLSERVKNHENVYGGIAIHFVQEDEPDAIGFAIAEWQRRHMDA